VVGFDQDLFGSCAVGADPLAGCRPCSCTKFASVTCEIDRTSLEVPASRYAAHPTIAVCAASTRGDAKSRMAVKESQDMKGGVRGQSPTALQLEQRRGHLDQSPGGTSGSVHAAAALRVEGIVDLDVGERPEGGVGAAPHGPDARVD
jgi:hypothetical protein